MLHICRTSEDEVLVTDGETTLLFMSRKGHAIEPATGVDGCIEIESSNFSTFLDAFCGGCDRITQDKPLYVGRVCDGCPVSHEQKEENVR